MLNSLNRPNFIVWLSLFLEILCNMWLQIFISQFMTSEISELSFSFQTSRFSTWPKKSGRKIKYIKNKSFWGEIEKHFSSYLKGFKLPEINSGILVSFWTTINCLWHYFCFFPDLFCGAIGNGRIVENTLFEASSSVWWIYRGNFVACPPFRLGKESLVFQKWC